MACSLCLREFSNRRKLVCASCAQATLYAPRIQQASALLDREEQHAHAEAILRPGNDGVIAALPQDADYDAVGAGIKKQTVTKAREERQVVEARINDITEKADELRQQIQDYKEWAAKQKEDRSRRRSNVATEHKQLEKQRPRVLEPVQTSTRKAKQRLEKVHNRTVNARALLCREAALLAGLQKRRGANGKTEYWLGGAPIPDLGDLHGKAMAGMRSGLGEDETPLQSRELISAGLNNVCRLLGNCCHYLSIRLPAEILLPQNDFWHAMILPEKSSYKLKDPPFPGMTGSHSASPAASRQQLDRNGVPLARPRPLHLKCSPAQLLKDDSKAFQMLVEGVMLLAYDVAWLCKSQGVDKITTFEDVCAIGKNLYDLLLAQEHVRPPLSRNISSTTNRTDRSKSSAAAPAIRLGAYSHASAQHFLSGAAATEVFRSWRLPTPARLADRLKAYLVNEISGAEWDIVTDKEWDEEREDELPVLVGDARRSLDRNGPAMSLMSVAPHDGADNEEMKKGGNGWMKVRGRGGEG